MKEVSDWELPSLLFMERRIAEFLNYMKVDCGFSETTIKTYATDLCAFRKFLLSQEFGLNWDGVDKDLIREWVSLRVQGGVKPQTIKRSLSSLRGFFRYLLQREVINSNPMKFIPNPKVSKRLPVYVRSEAMDKLFDDTAFPLTFIGRRDYLILLTLYSVGLRVSELVGLDVSDVDFAKSQLRVLGKRNKHRIVPFGEELAEAFKEYLKERQCGSFEGSVAFFVDEKGRRETVAGIRRVVKCYLPIVSTHEKCTPHVLRHSFATAMLNNGADLEAVKEILGHESVATTQIYTHATFAELCRAYSLAHPRLDEEGL